MTFGANVPYELVTWTLAEKFGWTLDYIESLPEARVAEWYQIEDGRAHARNSILTKGTP